MEFTPETEEELIAKREARLIPDDTICRYQVGMASEGLSKKGNKQFVIKLNVHHQGNVKVVTDYLMLEYMEKLFNFCRSAGLLNEYKAGKLLAADIDNKSGECRIGIQPAENGYAAKNVIKAYLPQYTNEDSEVPF